MTVGTASELDIWQPPIDNRSQTGLVDEYFGADSSFRWDAFTSASSGKPLSISALWACVSLLSGDLARLPLRPYRRNPDGSREVAGDHSSFSFVDCFEGEANPETTSLNMWRTAYLQAALHGAGYIWLDWSANGRLLGMYNLCPHSTCQAMHNGRKCFVGEMIDDAGTHRLIKFDPSEIFYIPFLSFDSVECESPLKLFRDLFNGALEKRKAVNKYVKSSFGQAGLLIAPEDTKLETVRKTQQAIETHLQSDQALVRTMALRAGWSYEGIGATLKDSDLAIHNEADVRECCRIYNIPPGMVGATQSTQSFASAEIAWLTYLNSTLSPWLTTVRAEANMKLRSIPEKQTRSIYFEHATSSYAYIDTTAKTQYLVSGIQNGWLSQNDARDIENRPRFKGGERFLRPLNLGYVDDGSTANEPDPLRSKAIEELAQNAIQRARSRVANVRLRKQDPSADPKEMEILHDMIGPACLVLGKDPKVMLAEIVSA